MSDAKEALKTLFEITVSNRKKHCLLKSKHNDVLVNNFKIL
jgi:hypothetical protein